MRKKDFLLIASQIGLYAKNDSNREVFNRPPMGRKAEHIAKDLASLFEQNYPKFDRQKFLTACGIEESETFDEFWNSPDMKQLRADKIKQ